MGKIEAQGLPGYELALQDAVTLAAGDACPPQLARALQYAVFPGGARVRPQLCMAVAAANGGSGSDGDGYDSVVSQLVILDGEVGMHGDPLWNAMRQTLSSASQQQPLGGASGASLLLRDALGGGSDDQEGERAHRGWRAAARLS